MAVIAYIDTGRPATSGGTRVWSHGFTYTGNEAGNLTFALTAPQMFLGIYHKAAEASGTGDLTVQHNAAELLNGSGDNFTTTGVFAAAGVVSSATDFAHGIPVDSDLTVRIATENTETGTLVLMFESYPLTST